MSFLEQLSLAKAREVGISTIRGEELLPPRIKQDFERAAATIDESGLGGCIRTLSELVSFQEERKQFIGGSSDQGRVKIDLIFSEKTDVFSIFVGVFQKWKGIRIEVTPGGYIHFDGKRSGRSSISPEEWKDNPQVVEDALGEAYKHKTVFLDKWEPKK